MSRLDELFTIPYHPAFELDDGGREAAGYRGDANDCACRAIAIVTPMDYQEAYELVNWFGDKERKSKLRRSKSTARTGVYTATFKRIMKHLMFVWTPTMQIGSGCQVHLRADELPERQHMVVRVSRHYTTMMDGVIRDSHDPSRNGTRCVYGYWTCYG